MLIFETEITELISFPVGCSIWTSQLIPRQSCDILRAVTNSEYRAHTAPLFSKLKILDIFQINTLDIAKFMFRYHNNLLPSLFFNLFMTNSQVHNYDTRTAGNYRVHLCRTNTKKFTILYQGPKVWKCLHTSITIFSSFSLFNNKVLEFSLK